MSILLLLLMCLDIVFIAWPLIQDRIWWKRMEKNESNARIGLVNRGSVEPLCKHLLPCGKCDLTKKICKVNFKEVFGYGCNKK